jgi:hypothetical protein
MKYLTIVFFSFLSIALSDIEMRAGVLNTIPHFEIQEDRLKFSIFPNPLKDQILFINSSSTAEKHIEIYNVLGGKKFEIVTTNESIFLGDLPSGIYIFKLNQNGMNGLKRLVIP